MKKRIMFIRKNGFALMEYVAGGDVSRKIVNDPNLFLYNFFINNIGYPKKLVKALIRYSEPITITYDKSSALMTIDQNKEIIVPPSSYDYEQFIELGIIND